MLPLIVRKSRLQSAVWLAGSLAVLGIGIPRVVDHEYSWLGLVLIFVFGGIAAACLKRLWDNKPYLIISEEGICLARWNVGTISWCDLSGAFVKTDGDDYICLTLRDPENFRGRMNKLTQSFNTATRQTGFSDFTVKPTEMGLDTKVAFELVREQIDSAKAKPRPTGPSFKYHPGN